LLKEHDSPAGEDEGEKATEPVKLFTAVTVMVEMP
jgi:hypothetical protein